MLIRKFFLILVFVLSLGSVVAQTGDNITTGINSMGDDSNEQSTGYKYIYYHSDNCPHCQKLTQTIKENNYNEKYNIIKKDVLISGGRKEWQNIMKKNNVPDESRGTPFFIVMGKDIPKNQGYYFVGNKSIKKLFETQEKGGDIKSLFSEELLLTGLPENIEQTHLYGETKGGASSFIKSLVVLGVVLIVLVIISFVVYNPFENKYS